MKTCVVINGQGLAGKDTVVRMTNELINSDGPIRQTVYSFSSIDPIKDIATYFGWNRQSKTPKDRKLLSDLKQIAIDYNDLPNNYLLNSLNKTKDNSLCFFHIREPEEIYKFKCSIRDTNCKGFTLLVKSDNLHYGNRSDDEVFNYIYDFTINNNADKMHLLHQTYLFLKKIGVDIDESRYIETCNRRGREE